MNKIFYIFLVLIILLISFSYSLTSEEKDRLISDAENKKEIIMAECIEDPYNCPCEDIFCEDILSSDDSDAKRAYNKCIEEVNYCKTQRQKGIEEMERQRKEIEEQCRNDLSKCDCSKIKSNSGKRECEISVANAKLKAQEEREEQMKIIEAKCRTDFSNCDCSSIKEDAGRNECENAIIEAKYQAEKERNEMIKLCHEDLLKCDCSLIENENGQKECIAEKEKALLLREKMENACKDNLALCDCSSIDSLQGRNECEQKKEEAYKEIDNVIKVALSKCFRNVDKCDCEYLYEYEEKAGAETGSYVQFCEVQKQFGLDCKNRGINCEKLENVEIYPPGMPAWLGTIFAKNYKNSIEKEKDKGFGEASSIIGSCINNPKKCECDKTPEYARPFCERMKQLQIRCYSDDYSACMLLEESENLPEGIPYFMRGGLDNLIQSLRDAREQIVKGRASKKVGDMILNCMDDTSYCDCSLAPNGQIRSFCQHKIDLVIKCKDYRDFDSCFILDEEPITDNTIPDFVKNYIDKKIAPVIETKKVEMFNEMKIDTICENKKTIDDCRELYYRDII
jgi:hypothetical protein